MKNFKDYISWVLSLILIILLLHQCDRIGDLKEETKIQKQNQKAILDSVRIVKNRFGEDISVKNVLIADNKELKTINKSLSEDLKKLEGKVKYISSIVTEIKNSEPIVISNTIRELPDGTRELAWNYEKSFDSTNSRILEGNSKFRIDTIGGKVEIIDKGTTISRDEIKIKLTTGLTELDKSYQIYVKTDYPGVTFPKIDGSVLDKSMFVKEKQPTFVIGPSISAGMTLNPLTLQPQPYVGGGLSCTFNVNKYIRKIKNFFK
jgi:hypothetical protein